MSDKPPSVSVTCYVCGCQEELELLPVEAGGYEQGESALARAGWKVSGIGYLCCPRCFTPDMLDWVRLIVCLLGGIGSLAIALLEGRPRVVVGYALAWGMFGHGLAFALWYRIGGTREPGRWVEPVAYLLWLCGLAYGVLDGLQEDRLPWWAWPFVVIGGGVAASRILDLVRVVLRFVRWLRGERATTTAGRDVDGSIAAPEDNSRPTRTREPFSEPRTPGP